MFSLNIDYKNMACELCFIGAKYDTDKSSQRKNTSDTRHCHPYTLFYNSLFKQQKTQELKIAEIGILNGSSLLMWKEYFNKSKIYGFEYDVNLINNFKKKYNNNNIILSEINVKDDASIYNSFTNRNETFDIIIDDSTHEFEDQIKVIKNVHSFLKPGGILIIEDIYKTRNENDYINELGDLLNKFQEYYFVSLNHRRLVSTGWNNDKLFVLVKKGDKIFNNEKKMTIITPSVRPNNLTEVRKNLDFKCIDRWIIVYDKKKIIENPKLFLNDPNCDKIYEYLFEGKGISGNPQRNFALTLLNDDNDTYLYYLDDDNIINPDIYKLLKVIGDCKLCTFNQEKRILGNKIKVEFIDTAMFLIDYKLAKDIRWVPDKYNADGCYIEECYKKHKNFWIYVNNDLCYYNYLHP